METGIRVICVRIAPTVQRGDYVWSIYGAGGIPRTFIRNFHYRRTLAESTVSHAILQRRPLYNNILNTSSTQNNYTGNFAQRRCLSLADVLRGNKLAGNQSNLDLKQSAGENIFKKCDEPSKKDGAASVSNEEVTKESERAETTEDPDYDDMKNKSLFVRFKEYFKKYWYLMLPVHVVTSTIYFGAFYYLATQGLSPIPLLQYWGVPEKYLDYITVSGFGELAVALAFYKVATPLRYLTTLAVGGVTVRQLRKRGLLRSSSQIKSMVKNKVKNIKEKRS